MAVKTYICDKCKKEMSPEDRHSIQSFDPNIVADMCTDCYNKLTAFLVTK